MLESHEKETPVDPYRDEQIQQLRHCALQTICDGVDWITEEINAHALLALLQQRDEAIKQRDVARKERNLARAQLTAMKTELVAAREIARRRVKESRELLIDRDRAREFARRCWQALDGKVRAGCPDVPTWVEAQHDPLD